MADLNVALLGLVGVLVGGYFNNFLAEDYRRFRDGQALAGALAGELESHGDRAGELRGSLETLRNVAEQGRPFAFPEMSLPQSPVFEANAEKIGLLGPRFARDVAFVYENIRSLRASVVMLAKPFPELDAREKAQLMGAILAGAIRRIDSSLDVGVPLANGLKNHAAASYWKRPETLMQGAVGLLFGALLVVGLLHYSSASEHGEQCTTTLDHGALHTVCK